MPATCQRYDGTLSPCNITSCSGAPKWRGDLAEHGRVRRDHAVADRVLHHGYDTASVDFGGIEGDCAVQRGQRTRSTATYVDGSPVNCTQDAQWNADFNGPSHVQRQVHGLPRRAERVRHRSEVRSVGGLRPVRVQPGLGWSEHAWAATSARREGRLLEARDPGGPVISQGHRTVREGAGVRKTPALHRFRDAGMRRAGAARPRPSVVSADRLERAPRRCGGGPARRSAAAARGSPRARR